MMITLIAVFGLLGSGMALVIYGTVAKNRWGINVNPVLCPRCHASLSRLRKPQALGQTMWGGGTCPACGAEVDKWGREAASQGQPRSLRGVQPQAQMQKVLKRKLIVFTAGGYFCLMLILDGLGLGPARGALRSTPIGWLAMAGAAAIGTLVFTMLFYLVAIHLVEQSSTKDNRREAAQRQEAPGKREGAGPP